MRERGLCFGLFIDLQGNDTYPAFDWVGNSKQTVNWTAKGAVAQESQVGVFWDTSLPANRLISRIWNNGG
jgi:hypothetical protein